MADGRKVKARIANPPQSSIGRRLQGIGWTAD